jgi:ATPase complex subunit ATP10
MAARLPRAFSLAARSARPALARPVLPVARFASTEAGPSQTPAQTPAPATPAESAEKQPEPEPTKSSDSGKDVKDVNGKGKDENDDPYAVPPLSRPPGVTLRPSSAPLTWQRKKELMLDQERHKAKRKALMKEARQGYFHDYNLARKGNGGKLWVAPPVLIRDDVSVATLFMAAIAAEVLPTDTQRALYFPDIKGKSLNGVETHTTDLFAGNISLVSILNTRISEEHAQGFVGPVLEDWEGTPHFRHVQVGMPTTCLTQCKLTYSRSTTRRTRSSRCSSRSSRRA